MWRVTFGILFLLTNVLLWHLNVLVVKKRTRTCRHVTSLFTTTPPHQRYILPFRSKTKYPETRNIRYLLDNPNICNPGRPVSLLFVVSSSPSHLDHRKAIRSTFANSSYFKHHIVRVAFFVGTTQNNLTQKGLVNEHRTYGDIIQGDFVDTYRNLTRKIVREFHWVTTRCGNVEVVAKIDDDVFVDTALFFLKFKRFLKTDYDILCNRFKTAVLRETKWAVADTQFRGYKDFPYIYCSGYAVIMKGGIISKLLKAASASPFFWIDDIYFSGILTYRLGNIRTLQVPNQPFHVTTVAKCFLNKTCEYLFGCVSHTATRSLWNFTIREKHGTNLLTKI